MVCHDVVRSGLPDGLQWVYGTVYCWVLSEVYYLKYLWLLYFHGYFYEMMVIYTLCSIFMLRTNSGYNFLNNHVG